MIKPVSLGFFNRFERSELDQIGPFNPYKQSFG